MVSSTGCGRNHSEMAIKIPTPGGHAPGHPILLSVDADCDYDGTISFVMRLCCVAELTFKVIVLGAPDIIR